MSRGIAVFVKLGTPIPKHQISNPNTQNSEIAVTYLTVAPAYCLASVVPSGYKRVPMTCTFVVNVNH